MPSEQEFSAFQQEQNLYQSERLAVEAGSATPRYHKSGALSSLGRFIRRNFLLLLLPALTFGGAATYLILRTPEMFLGEFQLLVEPMTAPESVESEPGNEKIFDYETLIRLLASPNVLSPALPSIQSQGVDLDMPILQRQLVVQRIGQKATNLGASTKLISVKYEDRDPEKIEIVLSELAKRFLQYGDEERRKSLGGGVEFIEKQLPEVRQRVSALEAQLQKLEQQFSY
ncbi:MAG: hypothetical protein HC810_06590 [Acaryochloridaceae cyanobacterium RL_2_7]|nr:hypothetical protein [Acaryochloridaceae cyanobacterium RL_2_7]